MSVSPCLSVSKHLQPDVLGGMANCTVGRNRIGLDGNGRTTKPLVSVGFARCLAGDDDASLSSSKNTAAAVLTVHRRPPSEMERRHAAQQIATMMDQLQRCCHRRHLLRESTWSSFLFVRFTLAEFGQAYLGNLRFVPFESSLLSLLSSAASSLDRCLSLRTSS